MIPRRTGTYGVRLLSSIAPLPLFRGACAFTRRLMMYPLYRWVFKHLPDGGGKRPLPRDPLSFGWRQQRRLAVHGIRASQVAGIQAEAEIIRESWEVLHCGG